jgi:transposase
MMSGHFWLTDAHMERLRPFFPKSRGKPRVDDRRVLSGIIYIKKNGLQWKDAPSVYGPPKTLYNRFVRWSRMGVFARIFVELPQPGPNGETIMIDSTHLTIPATLTLEGSISPGAIYQPIFGSCTV